MSELPSTPQPEIHNPVVLDNLTQEEIILELDRTLLPAYADIQQSFHGDTSNQVVDQGLRNGLDAVDRNADPSTRIGILKIALMSAVYQGATRSSHLQGFNQGHQPFTAMIEKNTSIDPEVKKLLEGVCNNKSSFLSGIDDAHQDVRIKLASSMKRAYYMLLDKSESPDISDNDKGMLGLGLVFTAAASFESWDQKSLRTKVIDDVSQLLMS